MSVISPVIDHIDGESRRIYLKLGVTSYHPVDDIYKEVRYMRRINDALKNFDVFVTAGGNVKKLADGSKRTSRYAIFQNCKVVPQDVSHDLAVTGEQLYTNIVDGEPIGSGSLCIDKTMLSAGVDVNIDYAPPDTEVIVMITGSGLSQEQDNKLTRLYKDTTNRRKHDKVNNTITVYDDDKITPLQVFNTDLELSEIDPL